MAIWIQLDLAAVAFGNFFAHPQAKPGTNIFLRGEKRLKHMSTVFLRHARAIVCNLHFHTITLLRRLTRGVDGDAIDERRNGGNYAGELGIGAGDNAHRGQGSGG